MWQLQPTSAEEEGGLLSLGIRFNRKSSHLFASINCCGGLHSNQWLSKLFCCSVSDCEAYLSWAMGLIAWPPQSFVKIWLWATSAERTPPTKGRLLLSLYLLTRPEYTCHDKLPGPKGVLSSRVPLYENWTEERANVQKFVMNSVPSFCLFLRSEHKPVCGNNNLRASRDGRHVMDDASIPAADQRHAVPGQRRGLSGHRRHCRLLGVQEHL